MKSYIQNLKSDVDVNKGFTLIELLVAAVIMSIVVTLAGTAFVAILQQNRKAEFESQRRTSLNRALDYMANEIRTANKIEVGSDTGEVIKLTIPRADVSLRNPFNSNASIISYSIQNGTSVWEGPKMITRKQAATAADLSSTTAQILVDAIKAPTTAPCANGANGFYACISSDGRKVDLYLYGKLSDITNQTMEVKSTVYTRAKSTTGI